MEEEVSRVSVQLSPDQLAALTRLRASFTPKETAEMKRRMARGQAQIERMANAATLEEQQRMGREWWRANITRPRVIRQARRRCTHMVLRPIRPKRSIRIARLKAVRRSAPTRGDPQEDPDPHEFPLSFVDRAPFLWRFRHVRCRFLGWLEGVRS